MPAPTGREECGVSLFDEAYWEERYRTAAAVWSGEPNRQLVAETAELSPGTALDAGSGEGADAIWLAGRGWRVTAVDFARDRAGAGRAGRDGRRRGRPDRLGARRPAVVDTAGAVRPGVGAVLPPLPAGARRGVRRAWPRRSRRAGGCCWSGTT